MLVHHRLKQHLFHIFKAVIEVSDTDMPLDTLFQMFAVGHNKPNNHQECHDDCYQLGQEETIFTEKFH